MKWMWFIAAGLAFMGSSFAQQVVRIDPTKTAPPISRYIYGQFIEHLGDCIYGGLWAEMVVDRKFFYPITDEYKPWTVKTDPNWGTGPFKVLSGSPWKTVGLSGMVTMEREGAFVGQQSVAIQIPGSGAETGISQPGLAVVAGKKYVGRIVMSADEGVAPVVVQLALHDGQTMTQRIEQVDPNSYQAYSFEFTAPISSDQVSLEILSNAGPGILRIGAVSLMPADNIKGFRADTIALLKELNSPIYRWPGGNFVSGYNWMKGLGTDRDKRAPEHNPAWEGVESHDVGIHEFMDLMDLIAAEPYVALNLGQGSAIDAINQVQYMVGPLDSPMGRLRASNGKAEPWKVKFWAVGNEMYGNWQLGFMPQDQYIPKHNAVAEGIRRIDPDAQIVAVGAVGAWSENMLKGSADHMTHLSEHVYSKLKPDPAEHAAQLRDQIRSVAEAHRKYRQEIPQLAGKSIPLVMDEWNFWYGDYIFGELGCRYRLKDGLGVAMGLHEFFRNSDLYFMANYAQTVNVLGAIKATRTAAAFETTGLVLKLYRKEFGTIPVAVEGQGNLDVAAAWTEDRSALTVAIVNRFPRAEKVSLELGSFAPKPAAKRWTIGGSDPEAFNEPGKAAAIEIKQDTAALIGGGVDLPAYSVSLIRFEKQ